MIIGSLYVTQHQWPSKMLDEACQTDKGVKTSSNLFVEIILDHVDLYWTLTALTVKFFEFINSLEF